MQSYGLDMTNALARVHNGVYLAVEAGSSCSNLLYFQPTSLHGFQLRCRNSSSYILCAAMRLALESRSMTCGKLSGF
jgi:hypothetical protein